MARLLSIVFAVLPLFLGGWIHGNSSGSSFTLNFAAGTVSGSCASFAACIQTTRAGPETCTNVAGILTYVAANTACINSAGFGSTWEARTNVTTFSQALDNAAWTYSASTVTAACPVAAPDGTMTASLFTEDTTTAPHYAFSATFTMVQGDTYAASVYLHAGTARYISLRGHENDGSGNNWPFLTLDTTLGTITNNGHGTFAVQALPNGWYRVNSTSPTIQTMGNLVIAGSNVSTAPVGTGGNPNSYTGTSLTFCAWGGQTEDGLIVGPYIPTTTVAVTRPADVNVPIGAFATLLASSSAQITLTAGPTIQQGNAPLLSANGFTLIGKSLSNTAYTSIGQILSSGNTASWNTATNVVGLGWNPSGSTVNLNGTTTTDTFARVSSVPFNFASLGGASLFWNGAVTQIVGASNFPGCTTGGCTPQAPPKTYFFNASTGLDANNCLTTGAACATITRLNGITYNFGDSISLDGGSSFTGCINISLSNTGLTSEAQPIVLGKYNAGTPVLTSNCTGQTAGIKIDSVNGVTVQDIDLEEGGTSPRGGVWFINNNSGIVPSGLKVQRMVIHGFTFSPADFGGEIFVTGFGMNDISVLNNTLGGRSGTTSTDDNCVIGFGGSFSNYIVQGNTCSNVGGATSPAGDTGYGFQPSGSNHTTASFNLAFNNGRNTNSCGSAYGVEVVVADTVVYKFNEVYGQAPTGVNIGCDNGGFDMDNSTTNGIMEYNYSHDNYGPGFTIFEGTQPSCGGCVPTNNITARFNISENDGGKLNSGASILNQGVSGVANIYNNTVWQPPLTGSQQASALQFCCATGYSGTGLVANNIFVAQPNTLSPTEARYIFNNGGDVPMGNLLKTFKANTYYGPGAGKEIWLNRTTGINTLAAWQAYAAGGDTGAVDGAPGFVGTPGTTGPCTWMPSLNNGPQSCPLAVYGITNASVQRGTGFSTNSISGGDGGRDYNAVSIPNGVGTGYNMGADGH